MTTRPAAHGTCLELLIMFLMHSERGPRTLETCIQMYIQLFHTQSFDEQLGLQYHLYEPIHGIKRRRHPHLA